MILNEDLFDSIDMPDVITDIELENDTELNKNVDEVNMAVINMINDSVMGVNSFMTSIRSTITTLNDMDLSSQFNEDKRDAVINILTSVLQDEQEVYGKLQTILSSIDDTTKGIEDGSTEAETILAEREHPMDESYSIK